MTARSETDEKENVAAAMPACISGWLVPGLGHYMLGRRARAGIFFAVVMTLFALGIYLDGELIFPLDTNGLLDFFAGVAELGVGVSYFVVDLMGWGDGEVTSVTHEYGKTFLIVAGLMNMLIVLDVFDIAVGRKQ